MIPSIPPKVSGHYWHAAFRLSAALRILLAPRQRLKNDVVFVGPGNMQQESL